MGFRLGYCLGLSMVAAADYKWDEKSLKIARESITKAETDFSKLKTKTLEALEKTDPASIDAFVVMGLGFSKGLAEVIKDSIAEPKTIPAYNDKFPDGTEFPENVAFGKSKNGSWLRFFPKKEGGYYTKIEGDVFVERSFETSKLHKAEAEALSEMAKAKPEEKKWKAKAYIETCSAVVQQRLESYKKEFDMSAQDYVNSKQFHFADKLSAKEINKLQEYLEKEKNTNLQELQEKHLQKTPMADHINGFQGVADKLQPDEADLIIGFLGGTADLTHYMGQFFGSDEPVTMNGKTAKYVDLTKLAGIEQKTHPWDNEGNSLCCTIMVIFLFVVIVGLVLAFLGYCIFGNAEEAQEEDTEVSEMENAE